MILCYGDSITKGVPGVSYLRFVNKKWNPKNCGLGGDTLLGLSKRIALNIHKSESASYILQIGTNDILLPFLLNHSEAWGTRITELINKRSKLCENECRFREEYENLLTNLGKQGKAVKVINIPCLGEDLESCLNEKVDHYNKVIKSITEAQAIDYIDFNGWQKKVLTENSGEGSFFISKNPLDVVIDSLLTTFSPASDHLSSKRGLQLTIDGCHLNNLGARGLASLVEEKFEKDLF